MKIELITQSKFVSEKEALITDGARREREVANHHGIEVEVYYGYLFDGYEICIARCKDNYFSVLFDDHDIEGSELNVDELIEAQAAFAFKAAIWRELEIEEEAQREDYGELSWVSSIG
jgi:hypothetical protein